MQHFDSIQAVAAASYEELTTIDDIGDITAMNIRQYFDNPLNQEILKDLESEGVNLQVQKSESATDKLTGLTFVITGTLPTLGRKDAEALIEKNGGKCSGSVSKKTSYLVAGDAAGSKLTKAQKLGVLVITEEELISMTS